MSTLVEQLRSLARCRYPDKILGEEVVDALELIAVTVDEERRRLAIAIEALLVIACQRQCPDNLMGQQDVAEDALRRIATRAEHTGEKP